MAKKLHRYEGEAIDVTFDSSRCIHAAECVHGLPGVFDPKKRPWVSADEASADEVVAVVECCPTGALKYERKDGGGAESPAAENRIDLVADGPLYAQGDVEVLDNDKNLVVRDTRVALCRCGASKNKPFCDGAHGDAGFEAAVAIPDPKIRDGATDIEHLRIVAAANGPLILEGPVTLSGSETCSGTKTALCRCGASNNKPFCDGAHKAAGFEAD